MSVAPKHKLTEAEYLAAERVAEVKSEFLAGEIYAMVGATLPHTRIVANAVGALHRQLEGRPCEVLANDMRVKVEETGLYTYPDVVVVCGEPRLADHHGDTLLNPTVILEVLSPSTEAYDRGAKFAHYRQVPTLREYVLVSQTHARVERFVRSEGVPEWTLSEAVGLDATLPLAAIGCALPLAGLYDRVEVSSDPLPPRSPQPRD